MDAIHIDLTDRIPPFLKKAAAYVEGQLMEKGFEIYLVGGSVRDLILKRKISDLDFTTNAHPEQMKKIFPRTIPVGEQFGTILVLFHHLPIEITTYRNDGQYIDGRRPESVVFGDSLYEDVIRRDFTINGMAYQVSQKLLIDYIGGRKDIENGLIRTIGNPEERFREDGLRPIRGCRIMANLGFSLDPDTESAMSSNLDVISKVAPERFYDEWKKTLNMTHKHEYWNKIKSTGIFSIFFMEFTGLIHDKQRWSNLLSCIEHSRPRNMAIYSAHFFYHEVNDFAYFSIKDKHLIRNLQKEFFARNRFPLKFQKLCQSLLESPLLSILDLYEDPDELEIKKSLSQIPSTEWFFHLRFIKEVLYIHHNGKKSRQSLMNYLNNIVLIIKSYRKKEIILYLNELPVNGNDISTLGFSGKIIGQILKECLYLAIESRENNNREILLEFVKKRV